MIRPERLTIKAQEAFRDAGEEARRRGNPVVNDAHLLLALLSQPEGVVQPLLQKSGLNVTGLTQATEREIARFPTQQGGGADDPEPGDQPGLRSRGAGGQDPGRPVRLDRAPAARARRGEEHDRAELGGLHVICTELHEVAAHRPSTDRPLRPAGRPGHVPSIPCARRRNIGNGVWAKKSGQVESPRRILRGPRSNLRLRIAVLQSAA